MGFELDEPCRCGSGDLYKDCHAPIFAAPPNKQLQVAQTRYANGWSQNADRYKAQGLYSKLALDLVSVGNIEKVFDIGCGLGHGLEALQGALSAQESLIIGVDENPDCIAGAVERLDLELNPAAHQRLKSKRQLSGHFSIQVKKVRLPTPGPIFVINADMLIGDPQFEAWIEEQSPFDAVTMWFMGVHKGRSMTKINSRLGLQSDRDNREALERKQIELASRLLRSGGVLQLVNRVVSNEIDSYRNTLIEEAETKLMESGLDFSSLTPFLYEEPDNGGSIRVSTPGLDVVGVPTYATSVLATKV
ncbi:MAG: class I SAM-dependent methyltransferase [Sulfitobacter sp.]